MFNIKKVFAVLFLVVLIVTVFVSTVTLAEDSRSQVVSTNPADGATNVSTIPVIIIKFSEKIVDVYDGDIEIADENGNKVDFKAEMINPYGNGDYEALRLSNLSLKVNTKYYVKLEKMAILNENLIGNEPYSFGFTTGVLATPHVMPLRVVSATLENGQSGVDPGIRNITLNYSGKLIDTGYENKTSFRDDEGGVYSEWSYEGNSVHIKPTFKLVPNTYYTIEVLSGAFKDEEGNSNEDYYLSFTTGSDTSSNTVPRPKVTSTIPADGAKNVMLKEYWDSYYVIEIICSDMFTTANSFGILVKDQSGNKLDIQTIGSGSSGIIELEMLKSDFKPNTKYFVTVPEYTFADAKGNSNEPYSFSFTTGTLSSEKEGNINPVVASTTPANGETDISLNCKVVIKFSEPVTTSDFPGITIKDNKGNQVTNFSVSYPATMGAMYKTNVDSLIYTLRGLKPNTEYTVNIPSGAAKSYFGKTSEPYSFSFTTGTKAVSSDLIFSDLSEGHWGYLAVTEMAKKGVVSGYSDGTFRPDAKVTREQFAKMMVLALELPLVQPKTASFKDINSKHWAYKYVESAKNYLSGYKETEGSYFRGSRNALREDVACALVKAKGYQNEKVDLSRLSKLFKDSNQISASHKKYVLIAYDKGLISGYSDKTFKPKGTLTRAEAAKLLFNAIYK